MTKTLPNFFKFFGYKLFWVTRGAATLVLMTLRVRVLSIVALIMTYNITNISIMALSIDHLA